MRIKSTMLATVATSAMAFAPMAMAAGKPHAGTTPTHPAHATSYGYDCQRQGASKKHVAGQKGTPYSQCVKAGAQLLAANTTA